MLRSASCPTRRSSELESLAVLVSPPPATVAVLVREAAAVLLTLTVSEIAGWLLPPARASARVQVSVARVQDQPVPLRAVAGRPDGHVSVTVTLPQVAPGPLLVAVLL